MSVRTIPPQAADYDGYIAALGEWFRGFDREAHCRRCEGSGLLATADEGDAWHVWALLPPGSDLAIRAGVVTSTTCPGADGTGGLRFTCWACHQGEHHAGAGAA